MIVSAAYSNTNLPSSWTSIGGMWTEDSTGFNGTGSVDTFYVNSTSGIDFTYESDIKITSAGGAASLLFRSNSNGTSGYVVNIDLSAQVLKFFKIGAYEVRRFYPTAAITQNTTYHLKVGASRNDFKVYFSGFESGLYPCMNVMDMNAAAIYSGQFGFNV